MIYRTLTKKLLSLAKQFPVIGLVGPRQSGKTTLVKQLFSHLPYVSLEDLDQRSIAQNDTRAFLDRFKDGVVIDEAQNAPAVFSYLQTLVDQNQQPGQFILTGSQNFTLTEKITQTLAGRIALLTLLPLSLEELKEAEDLIGSSDDMIFKGGYPRIFNNHMDPTDWYPSYIRTYVERDVRQITSINDLNRFQVFLKLCSGRIGQLLNLSSLANDCGISHTTARQWLSVLESSYLVYLLQPHHQNFSKRLIKMPKIYFYDTGLACSLLGIESSKQLENHYLKGGLFENMVVSELLKYRFNQGKQPNVYFWRDKTGHEVDCIYELSGKLLPIEIKSSKTLSKDQFKNLHYFQKLSQQEQAILCYAGDIEVTQNGIKSVNFMNITKALEDEV